jgi:hypothetical protein
LFEVITCGEALMVVYELHSAVRPDGCINSSLGAEALMVVCSVHSATIPDGWIKSSLGGAKL